MMTNAPFSKNDPPQTKVKKIVHHKTLPGEFPTSKALYGLIRSSSPLMRDALLHMDTDPSIVEIAASPNRFVYSSSSNLYGEALQYEHVPALRIKTERGRNVFIDVIPVAVQRGMKSLPGRTARLRQVLADDYGAGYAVHDEMTLHIQPRHRNRKIMWSMGRNTDDAAMLAVLSHIRDNDLPMTIGEMRPSLDLPPPRFSAFDEDGQVVFEHDLVDVDRVFAAVMRLAVEGHIAVDVSTPFSDATAVMWRETKRTSLCRNIRTCTPSWSPSRRRSPCRTNSIFRRTITRSAKASATS